MLPCSGILGAFELRAFIRCAETALVKTDIYPGVSYFSTKVTFGPEGVEKVHPVGPITPKGGKVLHGKRALAVLFAAQACEVC
ncbi:hypothetical protein AK812_SmicGene35627 [Symbiodinium microadriaticum]|uniref:Uncharacterized protein n=1 Tax=Symbiodinium microadriaticum TaxID=2951 RepID=A0A1Q9CKY8_SYMMI|nr:hypothetical protein AK812_SmicGene35627 [Symbiodinium microadriaticum]